MTSVGKIIEIWRYPISSVGGEQVTTTELNITGSRDDRRFGLIDAVSGTPASPEREPRWRRALQLRAVQEGEDSALISCPDGAALSVEDVGTNTRLSEYFDFPVAVAVYEPRAGFPLTRHRHRHFPAHLLTTTSLSHLSALRNNSPFDSRRFRPTFLIETAGTGTFLEDGWIGRRLRIGDVALLAEEQTKRCGVTFLAQPWLPEEPDILRSILRFNKRNLGLYCSVPRGGTVRIGDELSLEG